MTQEINANDFIPLKTQPKRKPTIRQIKFINYYLEIGNASKAAELAGYKAKDLDSFSYTLLTKPYMRDLIGKRQNELAKASEISIERKSQLLWTLAQRSMNMEDKEEIVIKAIAELNKMYGHYAPEQKNVQTVTIEASLTDIRNARLEYKKDR